MIRLTFANYKEVLYDNARIVYGDYCSKVQKNSDWRGGFKVGGCSICVILEEYDIVEMIK